MSKRKTWLGCPVAQRGSRGALLGATSGQFTVPRRNYFSIWILQWSVGVLNRDALRGQSGLIVSVCNAGDDNIFAAALLIRCLEIASFTSELNSPTRLTRAVCFYLVAEILICLGWRPCDTRSLAGLRLCCALVLPWRQSFSCRVSSPFSFSRMFHTSGLQSTLGKIWTSAWEKRCFKRVRKFSDLTARRQFGQTFGIFGFCLG